MISMTGFGYAEGVDDGVSMAVEIKSLNARYLDLILSLPPSLSPLEPRIRELLQDIFARGRLEVSVRSRDTEGGLKVQVDPGTVGAWKSAFENLADLLGVERSFTVGMFTGLEGVFRTDRNRDPEAMRALVESLLDRAAADVLAMRRREGERLRSDIETQLDLIGGCLERIAGRAPEVRTVVENSLRRRFREILGDETGEQRILLETAAWIVRTDINEEVVRLDSHIRAFREESEGEGAKGKKLDFLAQEMGREVNTIGSKSPDAEVSREVVSMKDALEKIREQLRNVE